MGQDDFKFLKCVTDRDAENVIDFWKVVIFEQKMTHFFVYLIKNGIIFEYLFHIVFCFCK